MSLRQSKKQQGVPLPTSNSSAISDTEDDNDHGHDSTTQSQSQSHHIDNQFITKDSRSSSMSSLFSLHEDPLPPPDEKDILLFTSDQRHLSFVRTLHMADCITMLNGFSGFYSVVSSLRFAISIGSQGQGQGQGQGQLHYIYRAMFFTFLGLFFDFFDGKVARLRKKASLIGQELDSLADLISFGVAPATIGFAIGLQSTVDTLLLAFCVLCGLARLARFNVTVANIPKDQTGKSKYFEGLPIPTSLWLVLLMAVLVNKGLFDANILGGVLFDGTFFEWHPLSALWFIQGCLMISKSLHVPKP
ncbi:unnamed protein product [Ambrosiozyma monospora]|uniref:CDP-diacylglycerol--serine O-phosphatidyltransferase n=1 Tax=Ambrosiozyma monospora TaxID=43982 RepID=A0A9W6Z166_AMBMO|nr:unnamed protein product [Ambrosiozyma monospora]